MDDLDKAAQRLVNTDLAADVERLRQDLSDARAQLEAMAGDCERLRAAREAAERLVEGWSRQCEAERARREQAERERDEARARVEHLQETAVWLAKDLALCEKTLTATERAKDGAYGERDRCVAFMARMARELGWRVAMGRHDPRDTNWEKDWRWIVYIDSPVGRLSWHIHDDELPLFDGIPATATTWDGHTTDEKYARMQTYGHAPDLIARAALSPAPKGEGPDADDTRHSYFRSPARELNCEHQWIEADNGVEHRCMHCRAPKVVRRPPQTEGRIK